MKKIVILFILIIAPIVSFSQIKVGIRIAPGIGLNRIQDKRTTDGNTYSKGASSFAFTFGPHVDFHLNDNLAFCTGLWWTSRKISVESTVLSSTASYTSSLQYLQFPISFKAYTNEFAGRMKIYVQLGGIVDVKISDKLYSSTPDLTAFPNYRYEKWYQYSNVSIYGAIGTEFRVGTSNAFYAGVFYQRGLINQARNFTSSINDVRNEFARAAKVSLRTIGLEVGFKF